MEHDFLPHITTQGYIFIVVGWGFVISLLVFSFYKMFKSDAKK